MNQKHKDQISPKMQTNLKISRKGSRAKDVPWISPNPEYWKCILRGLTNPNCDYIFPSLTSLSLQLRSQWLKMGENVFISFLWWLFVTLLASQCGNWNLALKSLSLLPLSHAPHASSCNVFPGLHLRPHLLTTSAPGEFQLLLQWCRERSLPTPSRRQVGHTWSLTSRKQTLPFNQMESTSMVSGGADRPSSLGEWHRAIAVRREPSLPAVGSSSSVTCQALAFRTFL